MTGRRQAGIFATAGVVVTGLVGGIVWGLLTPGIEGRVVDANRAVAVGDASPEFGAIARFFCIALVAGVVLAVIFWMPPILRGPLGVVALTIGAIAAGVVAIWVGDFIAGQRFSGPDGVAVGQEFTQPPSLRIDGAHLDTLGGIGFSWALLVVAPLTALVTYLLIVMLNRSADLGYPAPSADPAASSGGVLHS